MKTVLALILINLVTIVTAKEIELVLKIDSKYPMKVHYNFINAKNSYGSGELNLKPNDEPEYISVNNIPDKNDILIHIDKMNVVNRTVFNDPCEIKLGNNEFKAIITVGFTGDPKTHGNFTCFVSKS